MSTVQAQLTQVISYLPEQEQILLFEIAKRLVPDDIATPDDLEAIREAEAEYAKGETVPHSAINWG